MSFINTQAFAALAQTLRHAKKQCSTLQGHTSGSLKLDSLVAVLNALRAADIRAAQATQEMTINPVAATRASEANGGPSTVSDFETQGLSIRTTAGAFTQLVAAQVNSANLSVTASPTAHDLGSTIMLNSVMIPQTVALAITQSSELQDLLDALTEAGA